MLCVIVPQSKDARFQDVKESIIRYFIVITTEQLISRREALRPPVGSAVLARLILVGLFAACKQRKGPS